MVKIDRYLSGGLRRARSERAISLIGFQPAPQGEVSVPLDDLVTDAGRCFFKETVPGALPDERWDHP
jgi:hypothetical protein